MLEENEAISITRLSQIINVSKRTVQRELEYLPKALRQYNLKFASKTGLGIWIEGSDKDKNILLNDIRVVDTHDVSDREYRRKSLAFELLKEKGIKKLYWYSSKFKVSEATISTDLEVLAKWFSLHNLTITKKPGSGISVEGNEENYRKAISAFISDNIEDSFLKNTYSGNASLFSLYENLNKSGIAKILDEDILKRVMNCINTIECEQIKSLTESSYLALVLHIGIAVNRILQNETINTTQQWVEEFVKDEEYQLAKNISFELEDEFEIDISKEEIAYICLHIKGSKHDKINEVENKFKLSDEKMKLLINEMIYAFDPKEAYLLKQDDEFLQGLLVHLQPTILRLAYNMKIYNPMLKDIKEQYSEIFMACKNVGKVIERCFNVNVPEEEIGFITVHFGAALVRLEEKKEIYRVVNVGVVCSSGIGVSRLMVSKLSKIFKEKIKLKAFAKRELTDDVLKTQDFLVTSISLNLKNIEIIQVNPLLNDKNLEDIRCAISKYERMPEDKVTVGSEEIELDEIEFLAIQIKRLVTEFNLIRLEKTLNFDALLDKIVPVLESDIDNQAQIKNDIIERENLSTQIFPEFKFALLHARTNAVKQSKFAAFVCEDLTEFTDKSLSNIKIAFVMLIPKDENVKLNSEILGCISGSVVSDDDLINAILTGEAKNVKKELKKTLKNFLIQFLNKF